MPTRLVCVGLTTLDVLGRPIEYIPAESRTHLIESAALAPAGTAGGMALVAATLGLPVSLVSAIGDDAAGRFVRAELEHAGVETRFLATLAGQRTSTTLLTIRPNGERPNFHALGASLFMEISTEAFDAICGAQFVHWGGIGAVNLDGGPGAEVLKAAKKAGALVSCDLINPNARTRSELERVMPYTDYFLPNMEEALFLAQTDDPAHAATYFERLGAKTCIFKWGARGAVRFRNGTRSDFPAYEIVPVDTTSCGDSFCAGFLSGLALGLSEDEACRFAGAAAALVAQGLGTLGTLNGRDAVWTAMRNLPVRHHA